MAQVSAVLASVLTNSGVYKPFGILSIDATSSVIRGEHGFRVNRTQPLLVIDWAANVVPRKYSFMFVDFSDSGEFVALVRSFNRIRIFGESSCIPCSFLLNCIICGDIYEFLTNLRFRKSRKCI